jgi:hypothetical protein
VAIDLLALLGKFDNCADHETEQAFFRTYVPSVGRAAFLNIIYKAIGPGVMDEVAKDLRFPSALSDFYATYNGARLFVGALSIYGCLPTGQLLHRADPTRLLPFDIREVNQEFALRIGGRDSICIGSYSYDRSVVCLHRTDQSVTCYVGTDFGKIRQQWPSLDRWLTDEVSRLSLLFDEKGNRLVDKERLLPGLAGC